MVKKLERLKQTTKNTLALTSKIPAFYARKKVITTFAEKLGLVYFGYVDQKNDEHKLIRGITLSPSHRDNHYCIGSVQNYDVMLVERTDNVSFPGKPTRPYRWLILTIDLHTHVDLPHIFVGINTHSETFYANLSITFNKLQRVWMGVLGAHDPIFTNHYNVYAEPSRAIETERLLNSQMTKMIGTHFRPLDIEVDDQVLYIYADKQTISAHLLETMLKNGLWLADQLDRQAQQTLTNHQP
jgi:hypothetical protein